MQAVYRNNTVEIIIQNDLIKDLGKFIDLNRRYFIITDQIVYYYYAKNLKQFPYYDVFIVSNGEERKNFNTVKQIIQEMLDKNYNSADAILILGGGVIGDLGGFVASIYKRGIDYFNVPTSLMAQIDSSIGGKVGINFAHYKNQVGSFYHPQKVLIDPNLLTTLAQEEIDSGMCEIFKYAILFDREMYNDLLSHQYDLSAIIKKCVHYKVEITTSDEFDKGQRRLLNFGHTIGHAIEAKYKYPHGLSIAYGMLLESNNEDVKILLASYGIDVTKSFSGLKKYILQDKKRFNNKITKVKLITIGQAILEEGDINDYFI